MFNFFKKPSIHERLNKHIDKNIKTVFNSLNDKEIEDGTGYTKDEIKNMNRSTFKKFIKRFADAVKRFVQWLINKGIIVHEYIKNMDKTLTAIANIIKGTAQLLKIYFQNKKKNA